MPMKAETVERPKWVYDTDRGRRSGEFHDMHCFLVIIEKADGNYSAYSPDLPGCVATGKTRDQTARNMHEAIEMHVRGLLEDKLPVPQARSFAEYIAIPA